MKRAALTILALLTLAGCTPSKTGSLAVASRDLPAASALAEAQQARMQEIADTARTGASETPLDLPRLFTGFERIETLTGATGEIRVETLERQVEADAKRIADLEARERETEAEHAQALKDAESRAEEIRKEAQQERRGLLIKLFSYGAAGMCALGVAVAVFGFYSANKQLSVIGGMLFGGGIAMAGAAVAIDSVWFDRLVWGCVALGTLGAIWWAVDAVLTGRRNKAARFEAGIMGATALGIETFKSEQPEAWKQLKPYLLKVHDKAEQVHVKTKLQ